MLKLLSKIFFLSLAVLLINLLVRTTIPYFWDIHSLYDRLLHLKSHPDKYDVLFLGSSKTLSAIDPDIFDETVKQNGELDIKSFNLGKGSLSAGSVYGLLQQVLDVPGLKTDYIFYELRDLGFAKKNLHTNLTRYWLDWDSFRFVTHIVLDKNTAKFPISKKIELFGGYTLSYFENVFNVGMMSSMLNYLSKQTYPLDPKNKGYNELSNKKRKSSRSRKKKLNSQLRKRRGGSNQVFNTKNMFPDYLNKNYVKELVTLIEECEKRNIKLIVLVPPLIAPTRIRKYKAIYDALPVSNKVQVNNARKYPSLYIYENCYDQGHLNNQGAAIYTQILADKYLDFRKGSKKKTKK